MRAFESHVRVFERKQQEFKSYVRVFVMLCRFIYEGNGCDEIIVGQNMCMKVLFCCLSKYLKLRASCGLFSATPLVVDDGKAAKADELASRKAPKRGDVGAAAPKSKAKKIPKSIQPRPGTECEKLPSILNSGLRKPGEVPWVQRTHGDAGAPATGAVYVSPSIYIYIYIYRCPRQTKKYRKC